MSGLASDLGLEMEDEFLDDGYDATYFHDGRLESEHELDLQEVARLSTNDTTLNQRCPRADAGDAQRRATCAPMIPEALKRLTPRSLLVSCMPCLPGALVLGLNPS